MDTNDRRIAVVAITELLLIVGAWGLVVCSAILLFKGVFVGAGLCFAVACLLFSLHASSSRRNPAGDFGQGPGGVQR
jgi:cyanate permease